MYRRDFLLEDLDFCLCLSLRGSNPKSEKPHSMHCQELKAAIKAAAAKPKAKKPETEESCDIAAVGIDPDTFAKN